MFAGSQVGVGHQGHELREVQGRVVPVVGVEQDDGARPVWLGEGEIEGFGTGRVVPDEDYVMEVELIEHRGQVALAVGGWKLAARRRSERPPSQSKVTTRRHRDAGSGGPR